MPFAHRGYDRSTIPFFATFTPAKFTWQLTNNLVMKTKLLLSIVFSLTISPCMSQAYFSNDNITILKHIKGDYIDILTNTVTIDNAKYKFVIPYYEFSVSDIKIGDASIFAISKNYPQKWVSEAIDYPQGECKKKSGYKDSYYIRCKAKRLFSLDTTSIKKDFDIYVFIVERKDLDSSFVEVAEGGSSENYYPKKGSIITTYKYNGTKWIEVEKSALLNDDTPRVYGSRKVKNICIEKISKYIKP